MKKLSLFFLAIIVALTNVTAQSSDIKMSVLNANLNAFSAEDATVVGRDGKLTYLVTHNSTVNVLVHLRKDCVVMAIDDDMNIVNQYVFPDTKDSEIRAAHMYDGKIYILLSKEEKRSYAVTRYVVDSKKMQLVGEPKNLLSFTNEKKDGVYLWVAQSPEKSATAIVKILLNEKKEKLDATEILLDEEMNVEWQKDYPIYSMSDMVVTDEGEIVTAGNTRSGRLYVSVINADNAQDFQKDVDVAVSSTRIVSYKKGVALGMGMGTSVKNKKEIKYFGFAINSNDGTGNVSVKSLSSNEKDVFDNSDYGDKSDDPGIDYLVMRKCIATDDGGVGSIQMRWMLSKCNGQGQCSYTFLSQGALVFGVNNNGDIVWHHPIRSSSKVSANTFLTYGLCSDKDNVYVIQSEGPKTTTDMRVEMKQYNPGKGTKKLAIYTINYDGAISKKIVDLPEEAVLNSDVEIVDGYFTGYVCTFKKAALLKLKVK